MFNLLCYTHRSPVNFRPTKPTIHLSGLGRTGSSEAFANSFCCKRWRRSSKSCWTKRSLRDAADAPTLVSVIATSRALKKVCSSRFLPHPLPLGAKSGRHHHRNARTQTANVVPAPSCTKELQYTTVHKTDKHTNCAWDQVFENGHG